MLRHVPRLGARLAPALALASALVLSAGGPALADPASLPNAQDLVGVGAQATESLLSRFATDYNAALTAGGDTTSPRLSGWDSTPAAPIVPKYGSVTIWRPFSTDAGLMAIDMYTSSSIDYARAARPPRPTDPAYLNFVAMAKDAVSWASPAGGNAPATLTPAQLVGIYACQITNWRQISPALPDAVIRPYVSGNVTVDRYGVHGSGLDSTSYFLEKIDYARAIGQDQVTDHSCVGVVARENQGTDTVLQDPNALVPYSVGRYVGQAYGGHTSPGDEPGPLTPRAINGVASVNTTAHSINAAFAVLPFGRIVSNVVRQSEWTAQNARGAALRNVFGPAGWICAHTTTTVRDQGFQPLPGSVCGTVIH
ncbi:ABC-type phosphate transport system, substrate-binding protein [Streptomyces sp. TLI_053]|uniref:hypothetical protein n=1 Tax=Streptomyces sp. TLI_053 TaxID=1855352 RepID=UPI00087A4A0D|nr:hypothetical protein [Streptomyces sp. TLI_053]SDS80612.1 ABC-type phosphate transport system, substrate-binding protein [Streptomyces sp. TLI_053]